MGLLDQLVGSQKKVLNVSGGCHNCPRKQVGMVASVLERGSILWLGEEPGETEAENGVPFSGKSGQVLQRMARECGVPEPWSFSYALHCRGANNTKQKGKEVSCCLSQFVLTEIQGYPIVVLVGSSALQALFPGAKADHFRGNFAIHPDFPGQKFYAIYRPSELYKRPQLEAEFRQQLSRLARVARGEGPPAWTVVRGAKALDTLRRLVKLPMLSIDGEMNRLESWAEGGRITSICATADGKIVVAAHEDEPHFRACLELLADFVSKEEKSVIGAHVGFDLEWFERECNVMVRCQLIHDVSIQYYHLKQYKMGSLKEIVSRELDGYRFLIHNPHEYKDAGALTDYNAEDVVYPIHLTRKAMKELPPKTRDLVSRVLGPADLVLQQMSSNGLYLRGDYRAAKIVEYAEKRRAVISAWKAEDPEFIPTEHEAGDGLIKYLFTIRKLPVLAYTEGGQPSTDASVLKQLVRDGHTIVQHLLNLRPIDKIESTYLRAYDKHLWPDSRIRSHYPLTWTDSGRTSSKTPNLQNIPRDKTIRDLFGVPPGSLLLESDLSQIEFRIMVCLAGDRNGIEGYLRGDDAHTTTARKASGNATPTKEQRSQAKPINFGFLYGAHWKMVQGLVADDYGVYWTDEEAARFRELFFETYPALPILHEERKRRLVQNRGWFESAVGHIFHYSDWDSPDSGRRDHAMRSALNSEAQGPAAQLCLYIMVLTRRLLNERGFQSVKFVNYVHDSIMTEVPNPAWAPDVVAIIEEAKEQAYDWVKSWFIVPLVMEHAVGESWGSLKEIKA